MVLQNRFCLLCAFVAMSLQPMDILAQDNTSTDEQPQQYIAIPEDDIREVFFQGFSVSADLFSPAKKILSDYGGFEAALRINLLNTYLPIVELGYDLCDHKDANTLIKYKTSAPYFRIGLDYNLLKDKRQDNKLLVGLRYGISIYNFDISGPDVVDPIWKTSEPFNYKDINTTSHWIEIVAGVQVKIWRNLHLGWSVRYKHHISSSKNDYSEPYYIPGYGTTVNSSSWGGTYNVIFDLNWGKKKK